MCCVPAAVDPVAGMEVVPKVAAEAEEDELLATGKGDTTGVVPLSFKKLVQLGTLVAFGCKPAESLESAGKTC